MTFLRALWRLLFSPGFSVLEARALKHGKLTLEQIAIGSGQMGWHCSLRPEYRGPGSRTYAWTSQAETIEEAVALALEAAEAVSIAELAEGNDRAKAAYAPKLGGREFDE